ncbi:hypothetical protein KKF55_00870 [Patescibacteria group bacterium]|nr:hypothetical protein [Patescibacteria group bacterium]
MELDSLDPSAQEGQSTADSTADLIAAVRAEHGGALAQACEERIADGENPLQALRRSISESETIRDVNVDGLKEIVPGNSFRCVRREG